MRLPRIESLDLRSASGRREGALSALRSISETLLALWEAEVSWVEWNEISWLWPVYGRGYNGRHYCDACKHSTAHVDGRCVFDHELQAA